VQETPTCGGDGQLTCSSGFGLYHGADCSCTTGHGPCCIGSNTLDASPDVTDAPITDGSTCAAPQICSDAGEGGVDAGDQ
jgi:hypothetical protein